MGFLDSIKDKLAGDDDKDRQTQQYQGGYQQGGGYQYQQGGGHQQPEQGVYGQPGYQQGAYGAQQPYQPQPSGAGYGAAGAEGQYAHSQPEEQKGKKGWSTGAKVAAGVLGAAAAVGVGAYAVHVSLSPVAVITLYL